MLWKSTDIDVVLSPPTLPPCVFPRVRTGGGKTQLSHIDWIPLTQTEKNKKVFSSPLRCLGKDLLKVVLHRSTVLSGYRSDIALSKGIKELLKLVYIMLKSLLSVYLFPREECVIKLPSYFVLFFLFSLKRWED